jgi:ABC-type multidrug transport system fused ATPase/permease subunit
MFDQTYQSECNDIKYKNKIWKNSYLNHYINCAFSSCVISLINYSLLIFIVLIIFFYSQKNNKLVSKNNNIVSLVIIILIYINLINGFLQEIPMFSRTIAFGTKLNDELEEILSKSEICKNYSSDIWSIEFKNVYFKYKKENTFILRNLSVKFEPKKLNVLLGKSGSGKTTIMKLIIKMYTPSSGSILYNNIDQKKLC